MGRTLNVGTYINKLVTCLLQSSPRLPAVLQAGISGKGVCEAERRGEGGMRQNSERASRHSQTCEIGASVANRVSDMVRNNLHCSQQIDRAIANAPQFLHDVLKDLALRTGYTFFVEAGGPDPNKNDEIRLIR